MTIEFVTRIEDLDGFGSEWDGLVASSSRASPFLLRAWLVPWWREFGHDAELQVVCARESGRLVAALPLIVKRQAGLVTASFVGGAYTELADLIVDPRAGDGTARAVVDAVEADLLHVFGLPGDSALASTIAPERARLVVRAEAPRLSLTAGWEAVYAAKLSTQRRQLHRKRMRQLERQGGFALRVAQTPGELRDALEETFRLRDLRWRGLPDRAGFTTPAGRRFHAEAIARLAAEDLARIVLVEVGGHAIASYYFIRVGDRACATSMAYNPAFGRWSPGWIATLHALETAAAEGVTDFEFLGGPEDYKLLLADELAPLHEAFVRPKTVRARAYTAARLATVVGRRALKRVEPVRRAYYGLFQLRRRLQPTVEPATDA